MSTPARASVFARTAPLEEGGEQALVLARRRAFAAAEYARHAMLA